MARRGQPESRIVDRIRASPVVQKPVGARTAPMAMTFCTPTQRYEHRDPGSGLSQAAPDIHDLIYPKDQKLARWAEKVHQLWSLAQDFTHPQAQRTGAAGPLPALPGRPSGGSKKLCRPALSRNCLSSWLSCAPADNNAAERSLRPLVSRTLGFCNNPQTGSCRSDDTGTRMSIPE